MPDFVANILVVGVELEADGFALGDVANGELGGISGLPEAGWLGLSRMLLKTLDVAEPGLLPLGTCHFLL